MKNKWIEMLLIFVLVLIITGCGNKGTKASIVDNEGNKVEMTAKELLDINSENSAKFEKYYKEAEIELTGTVEKVSTNMGGWIYDIVYLDDNWEIVFSKDYYDLSELEKGTKIHIISTIAGKDPEHDQDIMAIYGVRKSDKEEITFEVVK